MKHVFVGVLIGFLTLGGFDSGVGAKSTTGVWRHITNPGKQTANGERFRSKRADGRAPHLALWHQAPGDEFGNWKIGGCPHQWPADLSSRDG